MKILVETLILCSLGLLLGAFINFVRTEEIKHQIRVEQLKQDAFQEGYWAGHEGIPTQLNTFLPNDPNHVDWNRGYVKALMEKKQR
jgi:hypothetical protein